MGTLAITLAACSAPAPTQPESDAVDLDHIKDATVRILAQGDFVEPGTVDPYEGGWFGSGFIIDPDGLIVTNYHVAGGADSMVVWIGDDNEDGDEIEAELVGYSECLDLALIQLTDGDDYPYMDWHEGDIAEGLDVYSAGFPAGDPNFTLTKGIVSKSDFEREFNWSSLDHVIEHDARIRHGNSGGPLVDEEGRVVGVNYAGDSEDDYNWAIHRDEVLDVLEDLEDGDAVQSLGMSVIGFITEDGSSSGVWVQSVQPDGIGKDTGLVAGDVILTMDGEDLAKQGTLTEYCDIVEDEGSDSEIEVEVYRPSEDAYYTGQFNGDELEFDSYGSGNTTTVEGFTTISDSSNTIEVSVPGTWTDIQGDPFVDDLGRSYTSLVATTDIDQWLGGSWAVPGVTILASDELLGEDINAQLANFLSSIAPQCTLDNEGEWDDGLYVGQYQYFTGCGGTDTDFAGLVAIDNDNTHMIFLAVQMVDETDRTTVLDEILATFIARY